MAALPFFAGILSLLLPPLDRAVLRLSGGRFTATEALTGLPAVLLSTTGARTGERRACFVLAIPDGERLILVASRFGSRRNPGWYYNILAHPEVVVTASGRSGRYLGREASREAWERYWRIATEFYPGYQRYLARAGRRQIPILILEPVGEHGDGDRAAKSPPAEDQPGRHTDTRPSVREVGR